MHYVLTKDSKNSRISSEISEELNEIMKDSTEEELMDMVYEAAESRGKAQTHLDKKLKEQKDQKAEANNRARKTAIWYEEGAWRQRWYGPPEYLWELMPEKEDPRPLYTSFRHYVLTQTEEVCHESVVRQLRRYA